MNRSFDTLIGILNGAIGDQLANSASPLATNAGFYISSQTGIARKLDLRTALDLQLEHPLSNKVVVFLHGLTNTESIWDYPQRALAEQAPSAKNYGNYGTALHQSLGYTPFFVRYNSGLPIEENGQVINKLLSQLLEAYPCQCDELVIIGFSMGGLISRLAQSFGEKGNEKWFQALHHAIYVGTPHEGARLEKFADAASSLLSDLPKDYFSHWADWINIRSAGIKDLKHGLKNSEVNSSDTKADAEPLEHFGKHAEHSFISGALSPDSNALLNKFFGDSLVTQHSANPSNKPKFSHSAHFDGLHHLELAHSPKVFHQIENWLQGSSSRPLRWQPDSIAELDPSATGTTTESAQTAPIEIPHSNADIANAAALLVAQTYLKALDTVETIHNAISREPYSVLGRIPPVKLASEPIEKIHLGISDSVFSALRLCGTGITKALDVPVKPS